MPYLRWRRFALSRRALLASRLLAIGAIFTLYGNGKAEVVVEGAQSDVAHASEERVSPQELLNLAVGLQSQARHSEALERIQELLAMDVQPSSALSFVLNLQGISHRMLQQTELAGRSYEAALSAAPANHHARFNLGALLLYDLSAEHVGAEAAAAAAAAATRCFWGALSASERTMLLQEGGSAVLPPPPPPSPPAGSSSVLSSTLCDDASWDGLSQSSLGAAAWSEAALTSAVAAAAAAKAEQTDDVVGGPVDVAAVLGDLGQAYRALGRSTAAVTALRRAVASDGGRVGIWANLAYALKESGLQDEAVAAAAAATTLAPGDGRLSYVLGSALDAAGRPDDAVAAWREAAAADPPVLQALTSLGHWEGLQGDINAARTWYSKALRVAEDIEDRPAADNALLLIATAVVPQIYRSAAHVMEVRRRYSDSLAALLRRPRPLDIRAPETSVGAGALGYYIIYQGLQDRELRQQLARVYWTSAPSLRYTAPFLRPDTPAATPDVAARGWCSAAVHALDASAAALDTAAAAAGAAAAAATAAAAAAEEAAAAGSARDVIEELEATAAAAGIEAEAAAAAAAAATTIFAAPLPATAGRRLRVGFISAFFFWHSVGLLTEGVITGLDRRLFDVTAIFLQPTQPDEVYWRIRNGVESVLDVPSASLSACQRAIAALELDVLVFTEIGMDTATYMLAFSRLARRSAVFWGHAVTSGISAADARTTAAAAGITTGLDVPLAAPWLSEATAAVGAAGSAAAPGAGGIDYFVSSVLFEPRDAAEAQRRYSERLYLMRGMTTRFRPPIAPTAGATRASLGVPRSCVDAPLYLVPQTLYKLHPDFDRLLAGIFGGDPTGCVVVPQGQKSAWTEQLTERLQLSLGNDASRVVTVPRLGFADFVALAALSDVVLDPFPVGGGRSSLEVFSVGTPIVMLYNRTSVLQLTHGMYTLMGMSEGGQGAVAVLAASDSTASTSEAAARRIVSAGAMDVDPKSAAAAAAGREAHPEGVPLVTYSETDFVSSALAVATDAALQQRLRATILTRNHRLYNQDSVVMEWGEFLRFASCTLRPPPTRPTMVRAEFFRPIGAAAKAAAAAARKAAAAHEATAAARESATGDTDAAVSTATAFREAISARIAAAVGAAKSPGADNAAGLADRVEGRTDLGGSSDVPESSAPAEYPPERTAEPAGERPAQPLAVLDLPAVVSEVPANRWRRYEDWGWLCVRSGGCPIPSAGSCPLTPDRGDPELLYALPLDLPDPRGVTQTMEMVVELRQGQLAEAVAAAAAKATDMDFLQEAWLATLLRHWADRLQRPVVWTNYLTAVQELPVIDAGPTAARGEAGDAEAPLPPGTSSASSVAEGASTEDSWAVPEVSSKELRRFVVKVREGDDLEQLARWHCYRENLPAGYEAEVVSVLAREVPQHSSSEWVAARSPRPTDSGLFAAMEAVDAAVEWRPSEVGVAPETAGGEGGRDDDSSCITLGVTTCRRLSLLRRTLRSLLAALGPELPGQLPGGARICDVIVVDDGSPAEERALMMSEFDPAGRWQWLLKGGGGRWRRGHADSLNMLLAAVRTRYLFYLEDDWLTLEPKSKAAPATLSAQMGEAEKWDGEAVGGEGADAAAKAANSVATGRRAVLSFVTANNAGHVTGSIESCDAGGSFESSSNSNYQSLLEVREGVAFSIRSGHGSAVGDSGPEDNRDFVSAALAVLDESPEELAQVLVNDQSPGCATALPGACPSDIVGTGSGWPRETPESNVTYRLHEFGILYPEHTFGYWPGFSLNPGLWDLQRLRNAFAPPTVPERPPAMAARGVHGSEQEEACAFVAGTCSRPTAGGKRDSLRFEFDPNNRRFEQAMSLLLQRAGLRFGCLAGVHMRHIGTEVSAYALNGFERPWDPSPPAQSD